VSAGKTKGAGGLNRFFTKAATHVAEITGRPYTFIACVVIVAVWAACGPFAGYSDTWQLIINTGTTIITFLMVFLIQNTQNRDSTAIQAKLDELIRALEPAQNKYVGIEKLTEEEIEALRDDCEKQAKAFDEKAAAEREKAKKLTHAKAARKK
jgi:low affinity Fe/Cu permease